MTTDRRVIVARKILEREEHCTAERLPMAHARLVSAVWMLLDVLAECQSAEPAVTT